MKIKFVELKKFIWRYRSDCMPIGWTPSFLSHLNAIKESIFLIWKGFCFRGDSKQFECRFTAITIITGNLFGRANTRRTPPTNWINCCGNLYLITFISFSSMCRDFVGTGPNAFSTILTTYWYHVLIQTVRSSRCQIEFFFFISLVCGFIVMLVPVPNRHLFRDVRVSWELAVPQRTCTKSAREHLALKLQRSNHAIYTLCVESAKNKEVELWIREKQLNWTRLRVT